MMVKKNFKAACFLMLILCLMGCAKETADDNSSGAETTTADKGESVRASMVGHAERYSRVSLSEGGIIYDNYDDSPGTVHLVTIDEGKDMVLCYNPNCKHEDPDCMGYRNVSTRTMYYNGAVYYFYNLDFEEHKLYRMETNGAGRKLIAELPFYSVINYFCICHNDKVYYTAEIVRMDETTKELNSTYRVVEVDLIDGSYRFLTEESKDIVSNVSLKGDTMYMRLYAGDDGRLNMVALDINTLEMKTIISKETWKDEYVFVNGYDEDSYFYIDRATLDIGIRNVDGTVERVLLSGADNERYSGGVDAYCNGIYYRRLYDYEDEPAGHYFMDLLTGEVTNITDEVEKYGLDGYEGYYDAFVADGPDVYGMWSREKIISEAKAEQ